VRPDRVVVASPALDDDLSLAQSVEDLAVEQLIAKAGVEALDVAVLPRAAPLDVSGLGTDSRDPFLHGLGDELRSVVGPDVSGNAPQDEEVGQNVDHIDRLELAGDTDRQAFMAELVEHVEHPILASVVGAVFDKVVGPDMIALLRPQPNARTVGQPEPAALGLLMGNLQPLTLPDTLDPLVVDDPARLAQELGDLAIAIAAVLPGKLDNIGGETLLVVTTARDLALRRAMLPERRTGATLGNMQLRSDLLWVSLRADDRIGRRFPLVFRSPAKKTLAPVGQGLRAGWVGAFPPETCSAAKLGLEGIVSKRKDSS